MRRRRFVAAKTGLSPNAPWGVHDALANCWAVSPKLSKGDAEDRADEMDKASRGRGR
jgi:hypothetical protein